MKSIASMALAGLACCLALGTARAATETTIYSFCSKQPPKSCTDGASPQASLTAVNGLLYGTTGTGGKYGYGIAFAIDPKTGNETVVHSFGKGTDGVQPFGNMINVKGTLYGTTVGGGSGHCYGGCGSVFAIDTATGAETLYYSFLGGPDGANPYAGLININNTLYGTTENGGAGCPFGGCGTVFAIDLTSRFETVLYAFLGTTGGDGQWPVAGLADVNGTFYGTTANGGDSDIGTIFSADEQTGAETMLHSFSGGSDGAYPAAGLIAVNGVLYGTSRSGGAHNGGTLFALDTTTGTESVVYSFGGSPDGTTPNAGLIEVNGTLYGTTTNGGNTACKHRGCGTVFAFDPSSGAETVLYSFAGSTDGAAPEAGLINVKGTLYGTTTLGGAHKAGTVFAIKP